jgi:Fe2+ or Zn2+ uptake regulation protein
MLIIKKQVVMFKLLNQRVDHVRKVTVLDLLVLRNVKIQTKTVIVLMTSLEETGIVKKKGAFKPL